MEGAGLPRPLSDRRRAHEGRVSARALVLVRPAVPSRAVCAAASTGRRRLAHRFPAWLGRRSRGRKEARARHCANPRDARRRAPVRARVGERLHVPVPPPRPLRARPRHLRRRCCAPGVAVRRARREQRLPGHRQPVLEAGARAARAVAGLAARELRPRAGRGRRREHPELDARDRLHHAEEPRSAAPSATRC